MNRISDYIPAKEYLKAEIANVLSDLGVIEVIPKVEVPADPNYGDFSTNVAMVLARRLKKNPSDLAQDLVQKLLDKKLRFIKEINFVSPGFVNFYLNYQWLYEFIEYVYESGPENFAKVNIGNNSSVQIEFVSANPTGPLHVGNGWWAAYGDSLARLLSRCGYLVSKEYYVNDTGGQIRTLGESILASKKKIEPPENGYRGEYIDKLAQEYSGVDDIYETGKWAAEIILKDIKDTLLKMHVEFDSWYSQDHIERGGAVEDTLNELEQKGLIYKKDGATFLASEKLGDSRDRVLIKSNGDITYTCGDIAYHRDKFKVRGFDRVIDVFGADHHGQVASLKSAMTALDIDEANLEIQIGQMISLVGAKMSKRSGNFVKLDDFLDDVGVDAARLMSLMNSIDQATVLDIDLVKSTTMDNPVYYLQYAYARICSIQQNALKESLNIDDLANVELSLLTDPKEIALLKIISEFEDIVVDAANMRRPHKITTWARQLASGFHSFYHDCKVIDLKNPDLTMARLALVEVTKISLTVALDLLGVTLLEHM